MLLSVLDQSPISEGSTGADALHNTLDLARLTDSLGYHRYWVAEHHGGPMLAGGSPEALIGSIASATERIRVGSGGVMLPHYSPFKVAATFSILAALYPGRIDLGIGRAAGTDPLTTFALQRDRRQASPDDFPQQLAELLAYFEDALPDDHPFQRLAATLPGRPELPTVWLLGSSMQSAIWAAQLGLPYAFADFINPGGEELSGGVGAVRADRRGGARARLEQPDDADAAAARATDPGSAGGSRLGVPGIRGPGCRGRASRATWDHRLTGGRARRNRVACRRVRRRRGDHRDDHARPRRPAAVVRADRRGDGSRASRSRRCGRCIGMTYYTVFDSPIGELLAVGDGASLSRLHMLGGRKRLDVNPAWQPDDAAFSAVRGQLDEYFAGERHEFELPLEMLGNQFERRVWDQLREIPYGETASYGEIARLVGNPDAARAVGLANGRNPIAVIVPCHRVIGADGSLTGYGGGLERKRLLLDLEAGVLPLVG
jgi:luciferase family oxidoreductase group 1